MKYCKLIISILILQITHNFLLAEDYIFNGKIGDKYNIYLSLEEYDDNEISALYFYTSSLIDIPLSGIIKDNQYILYFDKSYDDENTFKEKFILDKTSNGDFTGIWINEEGKELTVVLTPTDFNSIENPYEYLDCIKELKEDNSIDYIRTIYIFFTKDAESEYKGKSFVWLNEAHCSSPLFRLGNGFNKRTQKLINNKLEEVHILNTLWQLSCVTNWSYGTGTNIDYSVEIEYLTSDLLGFSIAESWYCGGAYPDWGTEAYLFDLNTAKSYDIDEIIAFDKSVVTYSDDDFDSFSEYRSNFFAPKLTEIIADIYAETLNNDYEDYPCEYKENYVWTFPSWRFTEEGIVFTPSFPHVIAVCRIDFLIPFDKLKEYKHPDFSYSFNNSLSVQDREKKYEIIDPSQFETAKYAGIYKFGKHNSKKRCGEVYIYPESDSTILFYFNVNKGEPSYNMAMLADRLVIKDGRGVYIDKSEYNNTYCMLEFIFDDKSLTIIEDEEHHECDFGFAVYLNDKFTLKSKKIPEYYLNVTNDKVYFKDMHKVLSNKLEIDNNIEGEYISVDEFIIDGVECNKSYSDDGYTTIYECIYENKNLKQVYDILKLKYSLLKENLPQNNIEYNKKSEESNVNVVYSYIDKKHLQIALFYEGGVTTIEIINEGNNTMSIETYSAD